jgi:rfaE bifunctional protein kinase chain/domain
LIKVPDFDRIQVAVAGDLMLDTYCIGTVRRQSPEAPVEVLDWENRIDRAGGAANVALNIMGLGGHAQLTGWIGKDAEGSIIRDLLQQNHIAAHGLMELGEYPTTHKTRYLHGSRHLLRVDHESRVKVSEALMARQMEVLGKLLVGCQAVVLQDYEKGYFNPHNIPSILSLCKQSKVPVAVDPKKDHFWLFQGVDLFKPNLKELSEALGRKLSLEGDDLQTACKEARDRLGCRILMVTLGDQGIALLDEHGFFRLDGHPRNVVDVCGAGDSVIAAAACCLALGLGSDDIAALANLCGGLACERSGTHPVSLAQIHESLKQMIL